MYWFDLLIIVIVFITAIIEIIIVLITTTIVISIKVYKQQLTKSEVCVATQCSNHKKKIQEKHSNFNNTTLYQYVSI